MLSSDNPHAGPIGFTLNHSIGLLQVNRPAARNALNWEAQAAFLQVIEQAARETSLRVLIIAGTGDQAFVAGGDLRELAHNPVKEDGHRLSETMTEALNRLVALPVPTIAAINGDAIGGGFEITLACDLRIMNREAKLRLAQVQVGLSLGWGSAKRLVQLIGQSRAAELLMTGRAISAQEAQQIGLIHRIAKKGSTIAAATEWAAELMKLPADSLSTVKAVLETAATRSPAESARFEQESFIQLYGSDNHREALRAFVEKRRPVFNQSTTEG